MVDFILINLWPFRKCGYYHEKSLATENPHEFYPMEYLARSMDVVGQTWEFFFDLLAVCTSLYNLLHFLIQSRPPDETPG